MGRQRSQGAAAAAAAEFEAFFRSTGPGLVGLGYVLTGNPTQAQDLAQETMTRAWERWGQVGGYDNPASWCRRVLLNLATTEWRTTRRRSGTAAPEGQTPAPDLEAIFLAQALRTLPEGQRHAIVLHDGAGLTVAEVAAQLEVPEGTVRSWLSRGRRLLAERLDIPELAKGVIRHG
jgi:RNA polymerase sigma-70 factor (ECF subfamily)